MMADKDDSMDGRRRHDGRDHADGGRAHAPTLWRAAIRSAPSAKSAYGNSKYWSAICSANSLENCNLIHVGDVLMLPTKAEAGAMMDKMMMDDSMDTMEK